MILTNQSYRVQETLRACSILSEIYAYYQEWIEQSTDFSSLGRVYDFAMAMYAVDMEGLDVCEVGARGSFLSSYLSGCVNSYHASDWFQGWGDFGDQKEWETKWKRNAKNPNKLVVSTQDMRKLNYLDDSFDVVMSFSAIEHVKGDGDIEAAREMGRVCKPGGFVIIGTDMAETHQICAGYYYDEKTLFERIIYPTGCELYDDYDFSWEAADYFRHRTVDLNYTCCIFTLRKPMNVS